MATIFLSYSMRDKALAKDLELRLQSKGHTFRIGVGTPPVGKWRAKLINALRASDAVVPLLSQSGLQSSYVASEIGAARAFDETKGMLLLPVVIGERFDIPSFVADYHCFYLPTDDAKELNRLAGEISEAIVQHVDKAPRSPRIFVSHRHKDESVAGALVSLLEAAFHIDKMDIRCTSVQPYTLAPGDRTSDRLRAEIGSAELVLGLLTPETAESNYVLVELGASWGHDVPTFPVLARGATFNDVPEPLNERHSISLEKESNCLQLVDDIARETSLRRRKEVAGRVAEEAKKLAEVARRGEDS